MPSKLTFSIEESLWLNRGQEISEVMSMSLEPNISIQEMEDHIVIKGGLLLHGEYRPVEPNTNDEDFVDADMNLSSHRLAKEVTVSEDGVGEVKHFIPIDVTIPANRIQNLEDIYVHIDSFDYDLPERSCIQLTADITISGMSETEVPSEPAYGEENPYQTLELEPFQFEARRPFMSEIDEGDFTLEEEEEDSLHVPIAEEHAETTVEKNVENEQELEVEQSEDPLTEREVEEEPEQEPLILEVREEQELVSEQKEKSLEEEILEEVVEEGRAEEVLIEREVVEEIEIIEQEEEGSSEIDVLVNLANDRAREEIVIEEEDMELFESEDEFEEREETYSSRTEENALYLTKMLQNGEEKFSKIKLCIIQENESLSTIAERYHVSTSQLIRANQLEEETVKEGQILYIPVSASR